MAVSFVILDRSMIEFSKISVSLIEVVHVSDSVERGMFSF